MKKYRNLPLWIILCCTPFLVEAQHSCRLFGFSNHRSSGGEAFDAFVYQFFQEGRHLDTSLIVVPIVVHIAFAKETDSLSAEQVWSQIEATNADLRRQNADAYRTRTMFKPLADDTQISLCLASKDPVGNPHAGINYHRVDQNDELSAEWLMQRSWNTASYMNIWVLPGLDGGWATFPWEKEAGPDLCVIGNRFFGTIGNLTPGFEEGGVGTHEVGHFLGLYHTFHDGFTYLGQCDFPPCWTTGDRVCDTPLDWNLSWSIGQCEEGLRFCEDDLVSFYVQSENFMSYSNDTCWNMFSSGQRIRMRAALHSLRMDLCSEENLQRTGCAAPTKIADIVEKKSIIIASPNPAITTLNLKNPMPAELKFEIVNGTGQKVYQGILTAGEKTNLDVSSWPPGIYILILIDREQSLAQKLIISH